MAVALYSCNDDEKTVSQEVPTDDEVNLHSPEMELDFELQTAILGLETQHVADILLAMHQLVPSHTTTVDDNTRLLLVPSLSEQFEDEITKVYHQGGIIAVADPDEDNFKQWFEQHGWLECGLESPHFEHALLYSFGNGIHSHTIFEPNHKAISVEKDDLEDMEDYGDEDFFFAQDEEGVEYVAGDDEYTEYESDFETSFVEDPISDLYPSLYSWLSLMYDDYERAEDTQTRSRGNSKADDVSAQFQAFPYSFTYPYEVTQVVRQLPFSSPDIISGNGSMSASFSIYQIHCFEGEYGAGDYYLVDMTASVANSDMYKGKWWNRHLGTYVRICGFYGKSLEVECTPMKKEGNTFRPYSDSEVYFPNGNQPSPKTTIGSTTYQTSTSFGLSASASVTAGYKSGWTKGDSLSMANPTVGASLSAQASISANWEWSKSESREVSDTDIENNYVGNQVRYKLVFNNLPKFEWSSKRGFNEGGSRTYRATSELRASWVWFVPNVPDDSSVEPMHIRVRMQPTYGSKTFVSTAADLETKTYRFEQSNAEFMIPLNTFIREKCGNVVINNDFENTSIKEFSIYRINENKKEELLFINRETLKPGQSRTSPALKYADKHIIYYTTVEGDVYRYSAYDNVYLKPGDSVQIYTSTDFKKQ